MGNSQIFYKNLRACLFKEEKNRNGGKSGRKDFGLMTGRKKGCIFRQGELRKMYGSEAVKKEGERP
jgi:hypothetical protein